MWVGRMPGLTADLGCERLLRNTMKEREILVVTVVRGGKVDIGYMIAAGATWRVVRALENLSCGNGECGTPVHGVGKGHCLSNFCTTDDESFPKRSVRNVSKRSATASTGAIELCPLSTEITRAKENWNEASLPASRRSTCRSSRWSKRYDRRR